MTAYLSPRALLLALALPACTTANKDETAGDSTSSAAATTAGDTAGDTTVQPGSASQTDPTPTTSETTTAPPPTSDTTDTPETTASDPTTDVPAVSFTDIYEQVILPNGCNAGYCHGGGAGGLELTDEATSYANLVEVGVAATVCDQTTRVVPGSLDESVLWIRVRPPALDAMTPCAEGSKMPKSSMGLADPQAELVRDWILGGALE